MPYHVLSKGNPLVVEACLTEEGLEKFSAFLAERWYALPSEESGGIHIFANQFAMIHQREFKQFFEAHGLERTKGEDAFVLMFYHDYTKRKTNIW